MNVNAKLLGKNSFWVGKDDVAEGYCESDDVLATGNTFDNFHPLDLSLKHLFNHPCLFREDIPTLPVLQLGRLFGRINEENTAVILDTVKGG